MDICPDRQTCISSAKILLKGTYPTLVEVGCDEAGRGCLAGAVFAAAVVLPKGFSHPLLNDSKQLNANQREELRDIIEREAVAWSVASIDAQEIDRINILNASIKGMHKAIDDLKNSCGEKVTPSLIFVDGNRFKPYGKHSHHCIIKGDSKLIASQLLRSWPKPIGMNTCSALRPNILNTDGKKTWPIRQRNTGGNCPLRPHSLPSFIQSD